MNCVICCCRPRFRLCFFLCSAVALVLFKRKQVGHKLRTIALGSFVLLSGGYLTFSIFDYVRYRQTGFILSPFNRFCFEMFWSPADLHLPYAMRRLTCQAESVSIRYRHRYGGLQRVEFRIVNDTPKEHPYSALTKLNLFLRERSFVRAVFSGDLPNRCREVCTCCPEPTALRFAITKYPQWRLCKMSTRFV